VQFEFLGFPPTILPPSTLQGMQKKNDFGFEYELYNELTWTGSPSPETIGYFVYRDGTKIATLGRSTYTYEDHDRPLNVSTVYSVVGFDNNGAVSSSITVTVS